MRLPPSLADVAKTALLVYGGATLLTFEASRTRGLLAPSTSWRQLSLPGNSTERGEANGETCVHTEFYVVSTPNRGLLGTGRPGIFAMKQTGGQLETNATKRSAPPQPKRGENVTHTDEMQLIQVAQVASFAPSAFGSKTSDRTAVSTFAGRWAALADAYPALLCAVFEPKTSDRAAASALADRWAALADAWAALLYALAGALVVIGLSRPNKPHVPHGSAIEALARSNEALRLSKKAREAGRLRNHAVSQTQAMSLHELQVAMRAAEEARDLELRLAIEEALAAERAMAAAEKIEAVEAALATCRAEAAAERASALELLLCQSEVERGKALLGDDLTCTRADELIAIVETAHDDAAVARAAAVAAVAQATRGGRDQCLETEAQPIGAAEAAVKRACVDTAASMTAAMTTMLKGVEAITERKPVAEKAVVDDDTLSTAPSIDAARAGGVEAMAVADARATADAAALASSAISGAERDAAVAAAVEAVRKQCKAELNLAVSATRLQGELALADATAAADSNGGNSALVRALVSRMLAGGAANEAILAGRACAEGPEVEIVVAAWTEAAMAAEAAVLAARAEAEAAVLATRAEAEAEVEAVWAAATALVEAAKADARAAASSSQADSEERALMLAADLHEFGQALSLSLVQQSRQLDSAAPEPTLQTPSRPSVRENAAPEPCVRAASGWVRSPHTEEVDGHFSRIPAASKRSAPLMSRRRAEIRTRTGAVEEVSPLPLPAFSPPPVDGAAAMPSKRRRRRRSATAASPAEPSWLRAERARLIVDLTDETTFELSGDLHVREPQAAAQPVLGAEAEPGQPMNEADGVSGGEHQAREESDYEGDCERPNKPATLQSTVTEENPRVKTRPRRAKARWAREARGGTWWLPTPLADGVGGSLPRSMRAVSAGYGLDDAREKLAELGLRKLAQGAWGSSLRGIFTADVE